MPCKEIEMRIAFFCEGFCRSSSIAQPWRHVYETAKRMNLLGHTVCIFSDEMNGHSKTDEIDGIAIYRIKKGKLLLDSEDLLKSFDKFDADIVNWHSGPLSTIYFQRLRKKLRNKIVWNVHHGKIFREDLKYIKISDIYQIQKFWTTFLYTLVPPFIIRNGANAPQIRQIITSSERLKRYFEQIGVQSKKVSVIPSGVDTKVLRPLSMSDMLDQKASLGFKNNNQIILFFGPLSSLRGADILISAMPKILRKVPSAKLVLLARKSYKDTTDGRLESAARKQPGIKLLNGTIEHSLVTRYLGIANIVVLPFRFWPYTECPLTVLEAMAMAKPVVTTYSGSIQEIIKNGETGILISPEDSNQLSQATTKLLTNKDLSEEIGQRARKHVEATHDWDHITRLTLEVFEKAADAP